ncbi:MAG: DUF5808 domain-containing protein [Chloroflexi bacterium]|nr:DUF5808 domain-containing protein [Chloroflexota bacterium]
MQLRAMMKIATSVFTVAVVVHAVTSKKSHGRFLGVPFEFRFPTLKRVRKRWWNREDPRMFTPHVFGVGWSLNLYQVRERLSPAEPAPEAEHEEPSKT